MGLLGVAAMCASDDRVVCERLCPPSVHTGVCRLPCRARRHQHVRGGRDGGISVPLPNGRIFLGFADTPQWQFKRGRWYLTGFIRGSSAGIQDYRNGSRRTRNSDEGIPGKPLSKNNNATHSWPPAPQAVERQRQGVQQDLRWVVGRVGTLGDGCRAHARPAERLNSVPPSMSACKPRRSTRCRVGDSASTTGTRTALRFRRPTSSSRIQTVPRFPPRGGTGRRSWSATDHDVHVDLLRLPPREDLYDDDAGQPQRPSSREVVRVEADPESPAEPRGHRGEPLEDAVDLHDVPVERPEGPIPDPHPPSPTGPWTGKAVGQLPKCQTSPLSCTSFAIDPQFSSKTRLIVSYYLPGSGATIGGHPDKSHRPNFGHIVWASIPM